MSEKTWVVTAMSHKADGSCAVVTAGDEESAMRKALFEVWKINHPDFPEHHRELVLVEDEDGEKAWRTKLINEDQPSERWDWHLFAGEVGEDGNAPGAVCW